MTRVRHIVLFRLAAKDEPTRADHVREMRHRLEALVGIVPGLELLQVRPGLGGDGHWDVALVSEHASPSALGDYQTHPAHREVVAWVGTVIEERAVVDVELG